MQGSNGAAIQQELHDVSTPPLANGRETARHGVVIGGGGPVGLALALALANHGVASVVIEADRPMQVHAHILDESRQVLPGRHGADGTGQDVIEQESGY